MALIETLLTVPLTWAVERFLEKGASRIKDCFANRAAQAELLTIVSKALNASLKITPSLAEDLRSEAFLHNVIAPVAISRVADPAATIDAKTLAEGYVTTFVTPWVRGGDESRALSHIFQTDRASLVEAMEAFVVTMRTALFASEHWKDIGRDRTIEETHEGVAYLVERSKRVALQGGVNLESAKADAKAASQDLLDWQRTIGGLFMARPELDLLITRIRKNPSGRTLLVGEAGSGKSALLSELTAQLQSLGMTVFGLKADMLPSDVMSPADISRALGLKGNIEDELRLLSRAGPVVLIIDQLDAVSDVMDRSSQRMKLLLRIANAFRPDQRFEDVPPIHILVSSRPFEAAHDARFQSLGAEAIKLNLPSNENVQTLLTQLNIDAATVPDPLRETLRRPFALRLFVDLVRREADVSAVTGSELLDAWLRSADLGDIAVRPSVIAFFERLASVMTQTETLWRPADTFDAEFADAVRMGEASGLIVRQDGRLGFSHQSWLDDFQAKAFSTGREIADFTIDRQDGLFVRATVLRALERLRRYDPGAYQTALDLLLGGGNTRRHVRHLVVDLVSSQDDPLAREQAWIQRLIRSDVPLARRAISKISSRWAGWRETLSPILAEIMRSSELKWASIQLLQAEAAVEPANAISLLRSEWASPDADLDVFEAIRRSALWDEWVADRLGLILDRNNIQDFALADYIHDLVDAGRTVAGVAVLDIYLKRRPVMARQRIRLHGLGKLSGAAPLEVASVLTPWFISLVEGAVENRSLRYQFPHARNLPFDWDDDGNEDSIYHALTAALATCARAEPEKIRRLLQSLLATPVDEAQALVAYTYAHNPMAFLTDAVRFLISDSRCLAVGTAHLEDQHGVGHMTDGYATQELLSALGPYLEDVQLREITAAIQSWDRYRPEAREESTAAERRMRSKWTQEAQLELLERLPREAFDARTRRQISEWKAEQPVLRKGRSLAHFVGSPMSTDQMDKAGDDELMRLLDECPDDSEWGDKRKKRRHISSSGGAIQVGRAFAKLGKKDPPRVLRLIRERLDPARHQYAAGCAIHEMSDLPEVSPVEVVALIHKLSANGFENDDWRRDAAWAFQKLAGRSDGLSAGDLNLLESWIVDDAAKVADQITRRLNNEAVNRERNSHLDQDDKKPATVVIFGHGLGRFGALPQENYSYLSALAAGTLYREPTDRDAWLSILERHALRAEDPAIWSAILTYHSSTLYWADRARVSALFERIWDRFPEAFTISVGQILWSYRAMVPPSVQLAMLRSWMESGDVAQAQAAGEFAIASSIVTENADPLADLAQQIMAGSGSPERLGGLFALAAAWRHNAGGLRDRAYKIMGKFAPLATGDEAEAISTALDGEKTLLPDNDTADLLRITVDNAAVLGAALNSRFADALQELLLHPGFDDIVLSVAEKGVACLIADSASGGGRGRIDQDFVAISIALQRSEGEQRSRAMDLYEQLLDAEVYGASEAAAAALRS